jgi:excisionase family DNA binding protein
MSEQPPLRPTIRQAAEYHNCSERHIRRLIAQGKLKAIRIGERAIRLERDSVLALGEPTGAS